MANQITQNVILATAQAANALTGNGTAIDVTDADSVVIALGTSAGTAGIFTFEKSSDSGANWSALTCTRVSDGTTASVTTAAENGGAFVPQLFDGPSQIRARISTAWVTASPLVRVLQLN